MQNKNSKYFMERAIELALQNVQFGQGGPFAALVVKDGEIIAKGVNSVFPNNDPTAHAEVMAIRNACEKLQNFQLTDCELYTTCEPCPMCLGAIYWARLNKVYFACQKQDASSAGFDDSFIYEEIDLPHEKRKITMQELMRSESQKIFEAWRAKEDKVEY